MKTVFADGSDLLPAHVNGLQAHVHDGVDDDGHASKVDPFQHIEGFTRGIVTIPALSGLQGNVPLSVEWRRQERFDANSPHRVELLFSRVYGNPDGSTTISGGALPANLRPAYTCLFPVMVISLSDTKLGLLVLGTNGSFTWYVYTEANPYGNFSSGGSKGFPAFSVTYPLW